jgi:hypothetical protein
MAEAAATAALLAQVTRAITNLTNAQVAAANAAAAAPPVFPVAAPFVPVAAPVVPVAAPVVPVATVFALWPGLANNAVIDYNTSDGRKICNKAVEPLATKYDLNTEGLQTFLAKVSARARESNWDAILTIPDSLPTPVDRNLIDADGTLSLDDCKAYSLSYINTQARTAQDSGMMFMFLQASLSDASNSIILINPAEYTVGGQPSGPCFLKVIIGKATVDTIATVNVLLHSISRMVVKMSEFNSNIKLSTIMLRTARIHSRHEWSLFRS